MALAKKAFEKDEITIDTSVDLGLKHSRKFIMWRDPGKETIAGLLEHYTTNYDTVDLSSMSDVDKEVMKAHQTRISENFFAAVTKLVIDCDIEGVSFDTVESTMDAFNNDDIPLGFLYAVVTFYVGWLMKGGEALKKVEGTQSETLNSGSQNEIEAEL